MGPGPGGGERRGPPLDKGEPGCEKGLSTLDWVVGKDSHGWDNPLPLSEFRFSHLYNKEDRLDRGS